MTALVGLLAFVVGGVAYAYGDLQGNITKLDVSSLVAQGEAAAASAVGAPTPTPEPTFADVNAGHALNILVMGTDARDGENADLGGDEDGMRADTTLLVHIPADRSRIEAVSIPRDLLVDIPACPLPDGKTTTPRSNKMFNSAFMYGAQQSEPDSDEAIQYAVACAVLTTQELTGLDIDDFVLVDFVGFRDMVDSLGGVDVCLAEPIVDSYTELDLPAGQQHLGGTDALQLARVRHNVGDGSDIGRIERQQQLLTVLAEQLLETDPFANAGKLYNFVGATTSSLTMSPSLSSLPSVAGLAMSLRHVGLHDIDFTTVPFEYAGNRVKPIADSQVVWSQLANDLPLRDVVPELAEKHANDAVAPDPADGGGDAGAGSDAAGSGDAEAADSAGAPDDATRADGADDTGDTGTGSDTLDVSDGERPFITRFC